MERRLILLPGKITLVIGERARSTKMVELAASMALRGDVHVLDAGNSFSAFQAARYVRRQTARSREVLGRILVARAFTCYQVITLLRQTPASADPKLVMGLLSTFYDEAVSPEEGLRLAEVAVTELHRLSRRAAVAVSISHPRRPDRAALVDLLMRSADRIERERPAKQYTPARLL